MTIGLLAFGSPLGIFGWFALSPAVGYITTERSSEAEQQALLVVPPTAARSVVNTTVSSTAAMGTVRRRRGAAGANFAVGETLMLQLLLVVTAFPSDAWAQHVVGSDEARSLLSRGGDTLIRWNISPAALQHMRSENFKRQFSPWGGKRNAATFESLLDSAGNQESRRHHLAADVSYKVRRLHPASIGVRDADSFSPWGGKRTDDKKDKDQTFNPWGGKRAAAGDRFGSWGGKRETFNAWGGKRQQDKNSFSPWGGKRVVRSPTARNEDAARARQDDGEEDEERSFALWGGKRGTGEDQAFSPWGGKRGDDGDTSFTPWGGKREDRFNPWGGKREGPFNPWGGKRDGSNKDGFFNPWGGKRGADDSFNPWGGKRQDSFNPWGGKREDGVFRPWGGKKEDNVFRPWGGKKEDNVFAPWGGKREDALPSLSVGRGFNYGGTASHGVDAGSLRKKRDSSTSEHKGTTSYGGKSGST
ncbi:uncharacterized protein LOC119393676 [Rhipicephalus sanguineus]|uniref:uncharacterized protein LOC119393676 n=1 Tax=Rhipicephalus sanguineus TaxID=34632 RepID=UPI0018955542|nr:uncharacterized protein LOC119393676 [Rhipicephalus sanguineus]